MYPRLYFLHWNIDFNSFTRISTISSIYFQLYNETFTNLHILQKDPPGWFYLVPVNFFPFFLNKTLHGKKYAKHCKNCGPLLNCHHHHHDHHHYRCNYRHHRYYYFRQEPMIPSLWSRAYIRHMILESTFTPIFLVWELFLPQRALLVVKTSA